MARASLAELAAEQHGVFSRAQAYEHGFSQYQIRRRLAAGEWQPVLGTVYAFAGARITPRLRDVAAHLAVPDSVLCGPSAARWHGIDVPSVGTYVVVARQQRVRLDGVVAIRDRVPAEDVWLLDTVYLTSPTRTVLDCLRILPDEPAATLLDGALRAGWTSLDELAGRVRELTGRRGTPRLAQLVSTARTYSR